MPTGGDPGRDGGQVQGHRLGVAAGQHETHRFALLGADCAEDAGRGRALIAWRHGPGATFGPAPGDLVLPSDAGFITEPGRDVAGIDARLPRNRVQTGGEASLKCSIAPAAWAWWRGRADSLR